MSEVLGDLSPTCKNSSTTFSTDSHRDASQCLFFVSTYMVANKPSRIDLFSSSVSPSAAVLQDAEGVVLVQCRNRAGPRRLGLHFGAVEHKEATAVQSMRAVLAGWMLTQSSKHSRPCCPCCLTLHCCLHRYWQSCCRQSYHFVSCRQSCHFVSSFALGCGAVQLALCSWLFTDGCAPLTLPATSAATFTSAYGLTFCTYCNLK